MEGSTTETQGEAQMADMASPEVHEAPQPTGVVSPEDHKLSVDNEEEGEEDPAEDAVNDLEEADTAVETDPVEEEPEDDADPLTTTNDDDDTKKRAAASDPLLSKPVKRARTAYFIFTDEKRAQVQQEHPGEGVAAVAKALGQLWSTLSPDEKAFYQTKAQTEKDRVAQELAAWEAQAKALGLDVPKQDWGDSTIFPHARIRKICKLDPDVKGLSKEALALVTKATEVFLVQLGQETVKVAQIQNRRKLLPQDLAQVCASRSVFGFLRDDMQDLVKQSAAVVAPKAKVAAVAPTSTKPLTDFFRPK